MLPYAVVEYKFHKRDLSASGGAAGPARAAGGGSGGAAGPARAAGCGPRRLTRVAVAGMGLLGPVCFVLCCSFYTVLYTVFILVSTAVLC